MLTFSHVGSRPPSPAGIPVGSATSYYQRFLSPRAHRMMHVIPWEVYEQTESGLFRDWAPLYALTRGCQHGAVIDRRLDHALLRKAAGRHRQLLAVLGRPRPASVPLAAGGNRTAAAPAPARSLRPRIADSDRRLARSGRRNVLDDRERVPAGSETAAPSRKAALLDTPYGCVEGLLNVPLHDGKDGHPLHPGANIVELLPEDAEAVPGNLIPSWKAEKGQRYEIFLTTLSGLARYRLHDIVQCTGHYHRAPRIVFCCKSAFVLKVTSTVIPENDLVSILLDLGYQGHDDLLAGPSPSGASVAVYLRESSGQSLDVGALDNALRKISRMYAHERSHGLLGDIESYVVPDDHEMWEWRNRPPAKARYILNEAPSGVS